MSRLLLFILAGTMLLLPFGVSDLTLCIAPAPMASGSACVGENGEDTVAATDHCHCDAGFVSGHSLVVIVPQSDTTTAVSPLHYTTHTETHPPNPHTILATTPPPRHA